MKKIIFLLILVSSQTFAQVPAKEISKITKWFLDSSDTQNVCLLFDKSSSNAAGLFKVDMDSTSKGTIKLAVTGTDTSGCNNLIMRPGESKTCRVQTDRSYEVCLVWTSPEMQHVSGTFYSAYLD